LEWRCPGGDSEKYDFIVAAPEDGRLWRVQVKGTGRLHRGGYDVQPVHSTRGEGKKRYTAKEIDVVAVHIQTVDVWYLIPVKVVGRAKSLRFCPERECGDWEEWREKWEWWEGR
jgi:hypothetical protein